MTTEQLLQISILGFPEGWKAGAKVNKNVLKDKMK